MASNILIVDDDKSVREILKDVLDEAGYSTVLAA
jgi:CheY-like chemotaxis protein